MFGPIIDLLIKKEEERRKIFLLLLKMAFTIALATKLFLYLFGPFSVISISDFQGIVNYFLTGKFIICFALFFLVWTLSYDFISVVLFYIGLWLTSEADKFLSVLQEITPSEIQEEIEKSPILKKYLVVLSSIDIVVHENNTINPGSKFYKLYDYLLDIHEGKKKISTEQFSSNIALIIQFIVVYNLFEFDFLSHSNWLLILAIVILIKLFISNFLAYNIETIVDIKHSRILNFLKIIEPSYKRINLDSQRNKTMTKPCQ